VSLAKGTATVSGIALNPDALRHAIEALGYKAR